MEQLPPTLKGSLPSTKVAITCQPHYSVLSLIRLFITSVAQQMGFGEQAISEIEMCVDEACANVMDHAYQGSDPDDRLKEVGIELKIGPDGLTVSILDRGVGQGGNFASGVNDLEEYKLRERPRGLGLYIINKLMDSVDIEFPETRGTRLTMTKLLTAD
jgi:serine/threonine-protein kinase RsbW